VLAACLKKSPGQFSIAALTNDREAYRYAQDWREVFLAAGWHAENNDTLIKLFTIAGGPISSKYSPFPKVFAGVYNSGPGETTWR
jgi:hypothetical protein